jgi:hypothetical protein
MKLAALLWAALPLPALAQYSLYACGSSSKDYVVGAKLPASGIFVRPADGEWLHAGFNHPSITAFDFDPRDPSVVYAAAGNGLLRVSEKGERWKILTGSGVTELLDVAVDRNRPGTIYFAHTAGIQVSHDAITAPRGSDASAGLRRKYTAALRVDSRRAGVSGGRHGARDLSAARTAGASWKLAGAAGIQVLRIEQSPHEPCFWLASTEGSGLFASRPIAAPRSRAHGNLGVGRNLYDLSLSTPARPDRIAVAGWGVGVADQRGRREDLAARALPGAVHPPACGAWPSTPRNPAVSSPACTKRPFTFPSTMAGRGARTGSRAVPSFA